MISLLRSASIHSSSNSFRLESLEPKWQVIIQPRLMIIDKRTNEIGDQKKSSIPSIPDIHYDLTTIANYSEHFETRDGKKIP